MWCTTMWAHCANVRASSAHVKAARAADARYIAVIERRAASAESCYLATLTGGQRLSRFRRTSLETPYLVYVETRRWRLPGGVGRTAFRTCAYEGEQHEKEHDSANADVASTHPIAMGERSPGVEPEHARGLRHDTRYRP